MNFFNSSVNKLFAGAIIVAATLLPFHHAFAGAIIVDHRCVDITRIPESAITQAKNTLHIAYGHTSHGSQLTDGMTGLLGFANGGQHYPLGNWATAWQASHTVDVDWYTCGAAHTQPLNANQKAYAVWWLWARLGGWAGPGSTAPITLLLGN